MISAVLSRSMSGLFKTAANDAQHASSRRHFHFCCLIACPLSFGGGTQAEAPSQARQAAVPAAALADGSKLGAWLRDKLGIVSRSKEVGHGALKGMCHR